MLCKSEDLDVPLADKVVFDDNLFTKGPGLKVKQTKDILK